MKRSRLLSLAITIASVVVIGACAGGGGAPTPSPQTLAGRTFLSTAVEGRVLVPGTRIRLEFRADSVSISAGCNSMGGTWMIDGGRLRVSAMSSTEMACDPPLMEQDRWVAKLLTDGAGIALDGDTLILAGGGIQVTLLDREVADPDRPIEGTRWVLEGIVSGDAMSSVPLGVTAAFSIADGRIDVEAGCNTGGGPVEVGEGRLSFGPIGLTKKLCAPGPMAVEQAMTAVLSGEIGFSIEADVLTLDAGNRGLVFRAAR